MPRSRVSAEGRKEGRETMRSAAKGDLLLMRRPSVGPSVRRARRAAAPACVTGCVALPQEAGKTSEQDEEKRRRKADPLPSKF